MAQSFVALTALAAIFVYLASIVRVGQMRSKHGIKAPATTGHVEFERAYRVQMNTLENLVPFLVVLFLFQRYGYDWLAGVLGAVWVAGRVMYMLAYLDNPEKRGLGFTIAGGAFLLLLLGALVAVLSSFL